jgi:hypothetical protein
VPTHIVSSICDDRGEEPTYAGVTMSTLMEGDYCVGDVISLLWQVVDLPLDTIVWLSVSSQRQGVSAIHALEGGCCISRDASIVWQALACRLPLR